MAKEPVTQLDLNAAFKALDDIPIPAAKKGIAANRPNISEAMKRVSKTDLLIEDYYNVRDKGALEEASGEREAEIAKAKLARIEKIVDLDADSEEDLLPSYEGKIIIQCPQCMTLFYKNPEDIEIDEESDDNIVNVNEVCQHCGNTSGYMVIGKVAGIDDEEADAFDTEDLAPAEDENELDLDFDETEEESEEAEAVEPTEEEAAADEEAASEEKEEMEAVAVEEVKKSENGQLLVENIADKLNREMLVDAIENSDEAHPVFLGYNEDDLGYVYSIDDEPYSNTNYYAYKEDVDAYVFYPQYVGQYGAENTDEGEEYDSLDELIDHISQLELENCVFLRENLKEETEAVAVEDNAEKDVNADNQEKTDSDNVENQDENKEDVLTEGEASIDDFKKLMNSSEFKKPISDAEVRGYLESCDKEELTEGVLDTLKGMGANVGRSIKKAGQKIGDAAGKVIKKLASSPNEKAQLVAAYYTETDPDLVVNDYKFYVVPYLASKGYRSRSYANVANVNGDICLHTFDLTNYSNAEKSAENMSKSTDKGICEVDVFLDKAGLDATAFVYKNNTKDDKGKWVPVTKHPFTFAAFVDGRNIVNPTLADKYKEAVEKGKIASRLQAANDTSDNAVAEEEAPVVEEPGQANPPVEEPVVAEPETVVAQEVPAEEEETQIAAQNIATERPARANAFSRLDYDKTKYNVVIRGKNGLVAKAYDSDKEAIAYAEGASVSRVAWLLSPDGKRTKYKGGVVVANENYIDKLEEIDEVLFEKYLTESLTNVYENVKEFKINECLLKDNQLIVEGVIKTVSKKDLKTSYIFESAYLNKDTGHMYLVGMNERINKNRIRVHGKLDEGMKFTPAKVVYTYCINDNLVEGFTGKNKSTQK